MADVRTLLRNERIARRIKHPYATYSSAGTLSCNVCNLRLQAESLWEPHLAGKVHRQNLQRVQATATQAQNSSSATATASASPGESTPQTVTQLSNGNANARKRKAEYEAEENAQQATGKKRKAADSDSEQDRAQDDMQRKKAKPTPSNGLPSRFADGTKDEYRNEAQMDRPGLSGAGIVSQAGETMDNVDEDEYAAFEAAIAAAPADDDEAAPATARNVLNAGADIAAAPITAAELASKEAEDLNTQRKNRRDEEIEGEKEDAARALEEEFDEMDQLEARVKKLRDMREKLRTLGQEDAGIVEDGNDQAVVQPVSQKDSDDDDDDDDYDDDWGFR